MSLRCGQAIEVKGVYGEIAARFIAQCEGRWLGVRHDGQLGNGHLYPDWRGVLRELVAMTVPAKLIEKQRIAQSLGADLFQMFPLTYPLPVSGLAGLLGEDAGEIRAQLADLAVQHDS